MGSSRVKLKARSGVGLRAENFYKLFISLSTGEKALDIVFKRAKRVIEA